MKPGAPIDELILHCNRFCANGKSGLEGLEKFRRFSLNFLNLLNFLNFLSICTKPIAVEYNIQQAANFHEVSRPHLVKFLESGKIPFKKVGKHRRVLLEDLVKYIRLFQLEREKALQELADQAQELDMGY